MAGNRALQRAIRTPAQRHPAALHVLEESQPFLGYAPELRLPRPGAGKPVPPVLRAQMEKSFGLTLAGVRVHEDRVAENVGANALTVGPDIHFARGHYAPHTYSGRRLIAHELTHVIQQQAGRVEVKPLAGLPIYADRELESEADRIGRRAVQGFPVKVRGARTPFRRPSSVAAQPDM